MSQPHRGAKLALGLASAALLASSAPAGAAAPYVYGAGAHPMNPRNTTEVEFGVDGYNPDSPGPMTSTWDFAGGSAFQELTKHTFNTSAVHPVSWKLTDAENESVSGSFLFATHPDNWAPMVSIFDNADAVTGQETYLYASFSDDSPESGWIMGWEIDGDDDFNDGEPVYAGNPSFVFTTFNTDGAHPVKFRLQDGQGLSTVGSATITTHTANRAPLLFASGSSYVLPDHEFGVYANASDDYTAWDELLYEWYVDGVKQDGATGSSFLTSFPSVGDHAIKVKVTEPGVGGLSSESTHTVHVVNEIPADEAGLYVSKQGQYDAQSPTFQTLENASIGAYVPGTGVATYAWDLDNDGAFDDATGYNTYFAAANKGTYKVAVQVNQEGKAPIVLTRDIVVDSGTDYAPKQEPVVTQPPAVTPPAQQPPVVLVQTPLGKVIRVIGPVVLSDGKVAGGKPGTTGQGVNLGRGSLFFGSVFSTKPAEVTVDYTVPLTGSGKVKASAAAKKKRAKVLKLGRSSVKLPGNASAALKVKLSAKAKKALKKVKKLKSVRVTARFKVKDIATGKVHNATKTIKLKVVKK